MMIDHPELELELMKMSSEVDPERYHPALERCFRTVEDQTGLDVIVAPHPKATPQSNARFGRRVVDMPTASLVRGSSLVLCHYTTAVSFPVIFRKPVLFLTTRQNGDQRFGSNGGAALKLAGRAPHQYRPSPGYAIDTCGCRSELP